MKNTWFGFFQRKEFKFFLICLITLIILEVGLNWWARTALLKTLTINSSEKVNIKAEISWMNLFDLYQGRVNWVRVKGQNCIISSIELENLELENHGFSYNLPLLFQEHRLEVSKLKATKINAVISEKALSSYLALTYPQFQPALSFSTEKISLAGSVNFLGETVTVTIEGEMRLVGAKTFRFYPKQLLVAGQSVPEDYVKFIGDQIPLEFSIMPDLPLKITKMSFGNGVIMLGLNEE